MAMSTSISRTLTLVTVLVSGLGGGAVAAALHGCNPYDPDLSDTPFRCVAPDFDCPDGYDADMSAGDCICKRSDAVTPQPDAAPQCDRDRSLEPNESTGAATQTPVGGQSTSATFQATVCSPVDADVFSFVAVNANQSVTATLVYNSAVANLTLAVLDQAGNEVATGTKIGIDLVATKALATPGNYFVRVAGSGPGDYTLSITLQQ
jgi:hypothetical protein